MAVKTIRRPLDRTRATREARRRVDNLMPGCITTVNSRGGYEPATRTELMVTVVTYPPRHIAELDLRIALRRLAGVRDVQGISGHLTITREV